MGKKAYSKYVILFFLIVIPFINISHHYWQRNEGMVVWDVKQYYAYLPAAIIYNDLSLGFIDEDPDYFNKWLWPVESPTGKRAIVTSMGLSFLYSPFFLIAHLVANVLPDFKADGYSLPYHISLAFSALFYLLIGLWFLRKILLRYYSDRITTVVLLLIAGGTNLLYYSTYEGPMAHCYNFSMISVFLYLLIKWYDKKTFVRTILIGLLGGLITLVRPTNIVVLLMIPLINVTTFNDFWLNLKDIFIRWKRLILMIISFFIVWIPQFLYWKFISGKFIYFSYGDLGGTFFFHNPQIIKFLLSYEKGWLVYTPIMLFSLIGFVFLYRRNRQLFWPIISVSLIMVYVLSSWWSWWFGGAFGQRSLIDFYGLLAIPLAAFIEGVRKNIYQWAMMFLFVVLFAFNNFQIQQYRHGAIHYWWMNKEAYWETFLKLKPTGKYWSIITIPDYDKAREGIYVTKPAHNKAYEVTDDELVEEIKNDIIVPFLNDTSLGCFKVIDSTATSYAKKMVNEKKAEKYFNRIKINKYRLSIFYNADWKREIEKEAEKRDVRFDDMLTLEAQRVFNLYGEKYDTK